MKKKAKYAILKLVIVKKNKFFCYFKLLFLKINNNDNYIKINDLEETYEVIDLNGDNQKVIVYCWNPACDRAEDLINILIDTSEYFGQFGKYFSKTDFSLYSVLKFLK